MVSKACPEHPGLQPYRDLIVRIVCPRRLQTLLSQLPICWLGWLVPLGDLIFKFLARGLAVGTWLDQIIAVFK
jgi:hypothetical protein